MNFHTLIHQHPKPWAIPMTNIKDEMLILVRHESGWVVKFET